MTIQFYCPQCDALIAFDSKHCGKRARCVSCGQIFIIPFKDDEIPEKIEPVVEKGEPVEGFYRAVLVDSWKLFVDGENVASLAFVVVVVCFRFFLEGYGCCGFLVFVVAWGWLLGFYLNIIYETAFGIDCLPQIYLGTSVTFIWYIVQPFLVFFFTMIVVQLPWIIAVILLQDKIPASEELWQIGVGWRMIPQVLFVGGLFFFPIAILTVAVGKTITMLRPDYLLSPVFKAIRPYLLVFGVLFVASFVEMQTMQYDSIGFAGGLGELGLNLLVQVLAIIAMRSIGLFYRHFSCHMLW